MGNPDPDGGPPNAAGGIAAQAVAQAHNAMRAEYDQLDDLWYPWLFARVHELIAAALPRTAAAAPCAFDAGCGTGFQSFLLSRAGYRVTGLDLAADLVALARDKAPAHARPPREAPPLFDAPDAPWLARHHARLAERLDVLRDGREVAAPTFLVGDLSREPIPGDPAGPYDVVTCCGSVLSFLDDYADVLARLAGSLRPGGLLFLEAEQRVSPDLLWPIADRLLGGRLDYGQSWSEIRGNLLAPSARSVRVDYPFPLHDGQELTLPIWLFSVEELEGLFRRVGLRVRRRIGIHQATNLLPSTVLHHAPPARWSRAAFAILRPLDAALGSRWPGARLGCGVAYALERAPG